MLDILIYGLCGQSVFLPVERFHAPGETLRAEGFFMEPGGKGYNQAVASARLGARVAFCGAVGDDTAADECEKRLMLEGAQARLIRKSGLPTAYACILTDRAGENRVTVYPGAAEALTQEDVEASFMPAKILLLTSEIPEDACKKAVSLALERHMRVVLNPAPWKPWLRELLPSVWCVTPNRSEARQMLGDQDDGDFVRLPVPRAAVTLGADGALVIENGASLAIPAPHVPARDTTGAGDCFSAALCVRLCRGDSLFDAARYAVRAAAFSVRSEHVLNGYPREEDL